MNSHYQQRTNRLDDFKCLTPFGDIDGFTPLELGAARRPYLVLNAFRRH